MRPSCRPAARRVDEGAEVLNLTLGSASGSRRGPTDAGRERSTTLLDRPPKRSSAPTLWSAANHAECRPATLVRQRCVVYYAPAQAKSASDEAIGSVYSKWREV